MPRSEAQKRAKKNYMEKNKIKRWYAEIPEDEYNEIEEERKKEGLSRREFILKHLEK